MKKNCLEIKKMKSKSSIPYSLFFTKTVMTIWFLSIFVVSYLSLLPRIETPVDFRYADKIWHILVYCWLSFLPYAGIINKRKALWGAILMLLLGGGLEFAQSFIPERSSSIFDMFANSIGVIIGMTSGIVLRRFY